MSSPFNVLLLGAGPINFGTTEGPWNHSKRLENILGARLKIVGVVDLSEERATKVLAIKSADDNVKAGYENTRIFKSLEEAASELKPELRPSLIVDGLPPVARGSTIPGRDNELRMLKLFPEAAFLIEKPISSAGIDQVEEVKLAIKGRVVSVGYMLRYLKAVQQIKKHIEDNNLTVMITLARYFLAYSYAAELFSKKMTGYWDKTTELGPVISQGTHLVDLVRYLSPPAMAETMHVSTVEHDDPAGRLSLLVGEDQVIPPEKRIPRVTNAVWSTKVGGSVNFIHGIALHEGNYDCEVVILADGWKFTLQDPYSSAPRLLIRRPGQAEEVQTIFTDDDCYETELAALIDVIEGRAERDAILSPYEDAVETYKLTWDITSGGEATRKTRLR